MPDMFETVARSAFFIMGGVGFFLLFTWISAELMRLACYAWKSFSREFRGIMEAEALICEYGKEREEYLEWKEKKKEQGQKT